MAIINQVVSGGGSAPETQYGINLKGWCGDISSSNLIRTDQAVGTLSIPGLVNISAYQFASKFVGSSGLVGTVSFANLAAIEDYGLASTFQNTNITGISVPALEYVNQYGLYYTFSNTKLTNAEIPCNWFTWGSFSYCFANCRLLRNVSILIPASSFTDFVTDQMGDASMFLEGLFDGVFNRMIEGCTNCVVHFYENAWQVWNQYIEEATGSSSPYQTAQAWADAILPYIDGGSGQATNSVVFDISAS